MKDKNWSYLAGLIDGEGHIGLTKGCRYWTNKDGVKIKYPAYAMQISIFNNDLKLMTYLVKNFGGVYYTRDRSNPRAKVGHTWQPKGHKNKELLLLAVIPYLIIKEEQAKLALEFLRMKDQINPEKREEMHKHSLELNRKGPTTPETNTSNSSENELKIESELMGDHESAPDVNQGEDKPFNTELAEYWETYERENLL